MGQERGGVGGRDEIADQRRVAQHGEHPLVVAEDQRAHVVEGARAGGERVEQPDGQVQQLVALELQDELLDGFVAVDDAAPDDAHVGRRPGPGVDAAPLQLLDQEEDLGPALTIEEHDQRAGLEPRRQRIERAT
jgi:hypothetical protein